MTRPAGASAVTSLLPVEARPGFAAADFAVPAFPAAGLTPALAEVRADAVDGFAAMADDFVAENFTEAADDLPEAADDLAAAEAAGDLAAAEAAGGLAAAEAAEDLEAP
ncbi:hypothetical protein AB0G04_24230 [Actinoplanes sp. NPDC023801]|uniref:hypothetical protein n=1 Tax=Actinoplanes sp. NPDC023801 TaxID=3154595 RepID=UPI0033D720E4